MLKAAKLAIEEVDRDMADLEKKIQAAQDFVHRLPDCPVQKIKIWPGDGDIWLYMPFDLSAFYQVRKAIGKGWKRQNTTNQMNGKSFSYRRNNLHLVIDMDVTKQGSTCQLEKIGEEVKPVYKVICK